MDKVVLFWFPILIYSDFKKKQHSDSILYFFSFTYTSIDNWK